MIGDRAELHQTEEHSVAVPDVDGIGGQPTSPVQQLLRFFPNLWRAIRLPDDQQSAEEAASSFFRFFRSKHVADLRMIFLLATVGAAIIAVFLLVWGSFALIGPVLTVYGAITAWAYLGAVNRLGVVDLFACEIKTLCRVGTIIDVGERYIRSFKTGPADTETTRSANFVSQEDYFPIFDGNSRDLEALEALVVGNITEFYTYMKATRDSQRKLAETATSPSPQKQDAKEELDPWRAAMANLIYMLYLGFESGRKAIEDLIEFEPTRAEARMIILITELPCYAFLRENFKDDELRSERLKLRQEVYRVVVPKLLRAARAQHGKNEDAWQPAMRTAGELERRYDEMRAACEEIATKPALRPSPHAGPTVSDANSDKVKISG